MVHDVHLLVSLRHGPFHDRISRGIQQGVGRRCWRYCRSHVDVGTDFQSLPAINTTSINPLQQIPKTSNDEFRASLNATLFVLVFRVFHPKSLATNISSDAQKTAKKMETEETTPRSRSRGAAMSNGERFRFDDRKVESVPPPAWTPLSRDQLFESADGSPNCLNVRNVSPIHPATQKYCTSSVETSFSQYGFR
jgi:hypothetical protein